MKPQFLLIFLCLFFTKTQANNLYEYKFSKALADTTTTDSTKTENDSTQTDDLLIYWTEKNSVGINLSEVAFVNWNAGGNNSVSALFFSNFQRNFEKDLTMWKNSATLRYGINAQEGREIRKTEDEIRVNSSFGFRKDSTSNWFYSGKFSFNTQFTNGYKYPDTRVPISKFMAPGYTFLGAGTEFSHPEEELTVYLSPITLKSTFVLDQRLANEGMFGVEPAVTDELGNILEDGQNVRTEFGFLVTSGFSKEVFDNIDLDNQLSLYSDYLNKFGNVDVDWQLNVNMKVNEFVKANVGTHIRYDDDVKFKEDSNGDGKLETSGPRIQLKQMLGVGLVYDF
ncbi:DUF3078 domain-containing protein [Gramella sp. GC03-9]|uniref:DUF3078 domain-containing protein n=1 Tax=Christiangramia oceanisediminis TaxID=2920386 RepID=A0A9X2KW34_9FLAO|nr:DUF3078 domain-containing protein [Gramella oceanisediminis]MCP9199048.1 DUF3078 domain-containing protein [Gramella oceanisediminis]